MADVYIERRKRGIFGWFFLLIFIGWNLLMLVWLIFTLNKLNDPNGAGAPDIPNAASIIANGVAFIFIIIVWALGSVITGLLAALTRGSKRVTTYRSYADRPRMRR